MIMVLLKLVTGDAFVPILIMTDPLAAREAESSADVELIARDDAKVPAPVNVEANIRPKTGVKVGSR